MTMQNVACPTITVNRPSCRPNGVSTVLNALFSAMPVTMPGSAIGRMTSSETRLPAEEPVALHRERGHRAQDQRDRRRAEAGLDRGPQGGPDARVVPGDRPPVAGQVRSAARRTSRSLLKELATTIISGM